MPNTLILEGKSLKEITKWQKYYNYDHLHLKLYSWYNLQWLLFLTTKNFNNIKKCLVGIKPWNYLRQNNIFIKFGNYFLNWKDIISFGKRVKCTNLWIKAKISSFSCVWKTFWTFF
jgi:hypothetical protein